MKLLSFLKKLYSLFRSLIITLLVGMIRVYQIVISPLFPKSCKYHPTCSSYSIQALKKYGIVRGVLKSMVRIIRCNPFSHGGYDPV